MHTQEAMLKGTICDPNVNKGSLIFRMVQTLCCNAIIQSDIGFLLAVSLQGGEGDLILPAPMHPEAHFVGLRIVNVNVNIDRRAVDIEIHVLQRERLARK